MADNIKATRKKLSDYKPDPQNANAGSERGYLVLDDSITEDGVGRSGLVDKNGVVIAGNQTLEVLAANGIEDVIEIETTGKEWVIVKRTDTDLSDTDPNNIARRMSYRDNRSQEISLTWNPEQLQADKEAGVKIVDKLWSPVELDILGVENGKQVEDPGAQVDRAAELQEKWQVETGDIWQIGIHRICCGDSTCAEDVEKLMDGVKMQGVFTSPPYAMQRKDQYGGIPADEYVEWWDGVQSCVRLILKEDGSFFVNIKPHCENGERVLYIFDLVLAMVREWEWLFIDELYWVRPGYPGDYDKRFRNDIEPVFHFSIREEIVFNPQNVLVAKSDNTYGKRRDVSVKHGGFHQIGNVTGDDEYVRPSNRIFAANTATAEHTGAYHPAKFPCKLPTFFIKAYSDENDSWYDPFLGSGTTIVAAENTGRVGYGMEISEAYVSVCLERLADMGLTPERT